MSVKKKNDCWIWTAINRDGKKFINCVLGSRGTETGKKLWNLINDKTIDKVATDYWSPYENFIPSNKHPLPKRNLQVKGYSAIFRHFLARLRRKTKCYSYRMEMFKYAILFLMAKRNNELAILN